MAAALLGLAIAAPAAQADVQLTMYYPIAVGGPLTAVVDQLVADFEAEHADIDVNAIYAGNYDDTRVRALSALASGESVQLSVLFSIDAFELIEQDAIVAFDEILPQGEAQAWFDSFYPALMANGAVDEQVWGIPFQRSTIVLYYNKEAFAAAGLDPDSPPATWAEMVEAAKALTADGRYGLMVPSTGYPYWMFQAFATQNGVELMSRDGTEVYFDDPAVIEALEFWVSLSREHEVMPSGTIEWGTLRQNFVERQTAMMWHTTGNLTAVRNEADFDFGVAMLPANVRPGSPTGGGNFYIFKSATDAEREAALTFIEWMTEPERAARWSIATGYVGISPASYETEALGEYTAEFPQAVVARDQLEVAVPELATYEAGRVREALNNAIQAALTGRQEPKQALADAQAIADRLLRPYR
jgi:sn-glycerol 3-phosphate transport system substrate-binding protein